MIAFRDRVKVDESSRKSCEKTYRLPEQSALRIPVRPFVVEKTGIASG